MKHLIPLYISFVAMALMLNPFWAEKLLIIGTSQKMAALRQLPFSALSFPRWQSVLAISFIGMLVGMTRGFQVTPLGMPSHLSWPGVVIVSILHWWLKRGGRWNGQGDLFNLIAASWLVVDTLGASFIVAGAVPLLTLPLWLYSVWVGAQAMKNAIPKASMGYCMAGIVIGLIPAMLAVGVALVMFGILPPPG